MWKIENVVEIDNTLQINLSNVVDEVEVNSKTLTFTNSRDKRGITELSPELFLENIRIEIDAVLLQLNTVIEADDITARFIEHNA